MDLGADPELSDFTDSEDEKVEVSTVTTPSPNLHQPQPGPLVEGAPRPGFVYNPRTKRYLKLGGRAAQKFLREQLYPPMTQPTPSPYVSQQGYFPRGHPHVSIPAQFHPPQPPQQPQFGNYQDSWKQHHHFTSSQNGSKRRRRQVDYEEPERPDDIVDYGEHRPAADTKSETNARSGNSTSSTGPSSSTPERSTSSSVSGSSLRAKNLFAKFGIEYRPLQRRGKDRIA